ESDRRLKVALSMIAVPDLEVGFAASMEGQRILGSQNERGAELFDGGARILQRRIGLAGDVVLDRTWRDVERLLAPRQRRLIVLDVQARVRKLLVDGPLGRLRQPAIVVEEDLTDSHSRAGVLLAEAGARIRIAARLGDRLLGVYAGFGSRRRLAP